MDSMGENKYQNGKIYKIVDVGYTKCYIGSTTETLSQRMARHRSKYNKEFTKGKGDQTRTHWLFDEFGVENCKIELIENYPCKNREELERQEGIHIKANDCINKIIAGRTRQEYYQDENDYICFRQDIYRELHPEKRQEEGRRRWERVKHKMLEQHLCGCGKTYTYGHKKRHEKSQTHQNYLKQQSEENE